MSSQYAQPAEWAQQQIAARAAQGLPPTVEDPAVLARVAALLQQGEGVN